MVFTLIKNELIKILKRGKNLGSIWSICCISWSYGTW